ncbi:hypothetical protein U9M48_036849 [Paspalum notatum var. saurae]|uniref:Uncharacterized protein n=1 Tax=Paspalum notatum var. saurae TaxID=547442 RepID=A0AAQ3UIE9_PASNO
MALVWDPGIAGEASAYALWLFASPVHLRQLGIAVLASQVRFLQAPEPCPACRDARLPVQLEAKARHHKTACKQDCGKTSICSGRQLKPRRPLLSDRHALNLANSRKPDTDRAASVRGWDLEAGAWDLELERSDPRCTKIKQILYAVLMMGSCCEHPISELLVIANRRNHDASQAYDIAEEQDDVLQEILEYDTMHWG